MATSDTPTADPLASTFPIPLSRAESHSWEYGQRCVSREGSYRETWTDEVGRQSLTVFDVTDHTLVLRCQTPVGRQSYYGMATRDYSAAREALVADEGWTVQTTPDGQ
ncbi:hypothetical protein [Haloarcula amylovorans]|uniref:hypothetical protein n=1 Tax=Haloarcula amylovorans TaxID=2562280 RepID=UPI0010763B7A|nr:hypothetical protein [Halomicroarcula amylolytica]